jgi:hypothetical protein
MTWRLRVARLVDSRGALAAVAVAVVVLVPARVARVAREETLTPD